MAFPIIGHHPETPTFELFRETNLPSIGNLDPLLTINGATEAPVFRYNGKDATVSSWPAWDYGQTLPAASTGTNPSVNQGSPLLGGTIDDSVKYNAGIVHQASDNTFAHIGTEDFVVEIVFKHIWNAGTDAICGDRSSNIGWHFVIGSPGNYSIVIQNPSGTASFGAGSGNLILGAWYHVICFADRSGFGACYLNGVVGTSINSLAAQSATLTNTNPFTIGGTPLFVNKAAANIAYCAMWKREAWLDTHLQATVAQERFYKLTGIYPQVAKGTALPTSYTRALAAYLDKYEGDIRYLHMVGRDWPRWCHRKDANGVDFKGYLPEFSKANVMLQSQNFVTNWAPINSVEDSNNRIVDGDMEAVGTAAWPAAGSATVSKQGDPHGGAQCLRVLDTGASSNIYTTQTLTVGKRYRVTGWARTGGGATNPPQIYSGAFQWTGTVNTSWYSFDTTIVALTAQIRFYAGDGVLNSYAEFDDIVVHEYLPLDNFDNKVVDGNMETVGVGSWTAVNSATLTKETGTPHGGSQVLRVARNSVNNPIAQQTVLTIGNTYRATGWFRSDGSASPRVADGITVLTTGTTAATWQYFDVLFVATTTTFSCWAYTSTGTQYCEFDDIQVSLLSAAPDKLITTMSLVADTTNTSHGVQQVTTLTAAATTFSVFAKAGNKTWIYLSDDTVAGADCYFDVSNGLVGTAGVGCTGYIENYGGGWYRCAIAFTGTAASHTFRIQIADADNDKTVTGNASTINTYLWGAQVETSDYMTSYIQTTSAQVTRAADVLKYKGDDGNLGGIGSERKGTVILKALLPDFDLNSSLSFLSLIDSSQSHLDRIDLLGRLNSDELYFVVSSDGGNAATILGGQDIFNDTIVDIRCTWKTNEAKKFVNNVQEIATDVLVDPPDDLDFICIGMNRGSTGQLNGLLNNIRIFKVPTTK